jgi:hypothetical protein
MKKWMILILCCAFMLAISGCTKKTEAPVKEFYGPDHPQYKMNVVYNSQNHTISGPMSVQFENNFGKTIKHIYFNLWPNATDFNEGAVSVSQVKFNNKMVDFKVKGTVLDIHGLSFENGEKAAVEMNFTVTIPEKVDRFGWYGTNVTLGNWFPILAVYDNKGWNLNPYYDEGDSFYSLTGDFDVTLKTDSKEVIAATGQEIGEPVKQDDQLIHHYQAKNVRDFALVLNSGFHVMTEMEGNTKINVFYTDDEEKQMYDLMATGHYALKNFNQMYGAYPWPELDLVGIGPAWFAGMEYPQLVMMSLKEDTGRNYIYSIGEHEIAHQWFYGVVGNNEYDDPWLDESFATFSANVILKELPGLNRVTEPPEKYYHLSSPVSLYVRHKKDDGDRIYKQTVYYYGAKTLNDLRRKLGDDVFYKGMRAYYQQMKFKVATTRDFINIMEKSSGKDLSGFFEDHRVFASEKD